MTPEALTRSRSIDRRHHRGTAEIELLLSVFALVGILLLTTVCVRIALARLGTADNAALRAARYTATGEAAGQVEAFTPILGYANRRPGLPNQAFAPRETRRVDMTQGSVSSSFGITLKGTAVAISPSWTFPADPLGNGDRAATERWFQNYLDESHGTLTGPLQLAPAWPP